MKNKESDLQLIFRFRQDRRYFRPCLFFTYRRWHRPQRTVFKSSAFI